MTVRLFEPSRKPRDPQKRSKPAEVVPLDRSRFSPVTRARLQAFARSQMEARRWAGVEQHWTDDELEYWAVFLPRSEVPAFDISRDARGRYVVADRGTVLARVSEEGLFSWLQGA